MKNYISLILTCLLASIATAQGTSGISGMVVNGNSQPLEYVSVSIYKSSDSSFVTGDVTDTLGYFNISVASGNYYLKVSYLSFQVQYVSSIQVTGSVVMLNDIVLTTSTADIKSTQITYEKSKVELSIDKKIFHVGKDISSQGKDALSVLAKVPSVSVSQSGGIKVNGRGNVRILIDGKPIPGSPLETLRSIPASNVERVEVITNPSARYDAEGEVGIINIVLKHERKNGFTGSVTFTAGQPYTANFNTNFNYKVDKLTVFGYGRHSESKSFGENITEQRYTLPDTTYSFNQYTTTNRDNLGGGYTVGLGYDFNKYNSVRVSFADYDNSYDNERFHSFYDLNSKGDTANSVNRFNDDDMQYISNDFNFSHTKTYDVKKKKWSTTGYYRVGERNKNIFIRETSTTKPTLLQTNFDLQTTSNFLLKTDYYLPLSNKRFFETGAQANLEQVESRYGATEQNELGEWITINNISNSLRYNEDVYAGYAMYGSEQNRFKYQLGLRAEYTGIGLQLLDTNLSYPQEYFNLFPSSHFTYQLDSTNGLQLGYSRRIFRPYYFMLKPAVNISNARNTWSGNPKLRPLLSHSFQLGYLKDFEEGSLLTSISYWRTGENIEHVLQTDSNGFLYTLPVNLSVSQGLTLNVFLEYVITDWWDIYIDASTYHSRTTGSYEGVDLGVSATSFYSDVSSLFYIGDNWEIQLDAFYYAPENIVQGKDKSIFYLDFTIGASILKNKGRLTFSIEDVFNSDIDRGIYETQGLYQTNWNQYQKRQFELSFTYRFKRKME